MSLKLQILDLLAVARHGHQDFISTLSDAERATEGTPQEWAAKDIMAHCTFWEEVLSERLAAAARGETPAATSDFQHLNEETFEARKNRTWPDVTADLNRVFETLAAQVQTFSEADLAEPGRFTWVDNGRALWRSIGGSTLLHPSQHFAEFNLKRGDTASAICTMESVIDILKQVDNGSWRGTGIYNLACILALAGQPTRAIPVLAESLKIEPGLADWSKQDGDLASLREMAEYKALYAA